MWTIMLSGVSHYKPIQTIERLFLTSCLLANLVLAGSFQGSLTRSFSTTSFYRDINTLEELADSGLTIGSSSNYIENIFGDDNLAVIKTLQSRIKKKMHDFSLDQTAYKRDVCGIERLTDIKVIIADKYTLPDGTVLLNTVKECPRSYYLAYIVRKGFPLLPRFDEILLRLFEAGFLQKWYRHTENAMIVHLKFHRFENSEKKQLKPFSMRDTQTAFYCLGIGLLLCLVTFIIELFGTVHWAKHKRVLRVDIRLGQVIQEGIWRRKIEKHKERSDILRRKRNKIKKRARTKMPSFRL